MTTDNDLDTEHSEQIVIGPPGTGKTTWLSKQVNLATEAGGSQQRTGEGTGLSSVTLRKHLAAAVTAGLGQDGPTPDEVQLSRLAGINRAEPRRVDTPVEDSLIPWADQIHQWLTGDRLQVTRIQELLLGRGCQVSHQSLRRFVEKSSWRRPTKTTVRMEDTAPDEVAEVDLGRLGLIHGPDTGRRRTVWALIVVLGYSKHCFVRPTFDQAEGLHRRAGVCLGLLRRHPPVTW